MERSEEHKFPCPKCGVEIGFVLNLDQEAATLNYEDPTNAHWVDVDEDGAASILFYPEVMIPRDLQHPLSPFVATLGNFKDIQEYQGSEASRRHVKDKVWPVLQRVYVHYENGSLELMKKEVAQIVIGFQSDLKDEEDRAGWLMHTTKHYFDLFVAEPARSHDLGKMMARAAVTHEAALRNLAEQYISSGRMAALWKELKSVRRQFMELYESLLPILMVRRHWREDRQDITEYELSVKNFEDLKGFYIDCVETSFRLLVIGLAGRPDRANWHHDD